MSEPKTQPTDASVADFIDAVEPARRREDARAVCDMLAEIMGEAPVMWGASIVGFGRYTQVNAAKKSADWPLIAFSPRKANLVVYAMAGASERPDLLARLGKVKTSAACLYINRLEDVDMGALRALCEWSVATMRARYPAG
ncbi:DUF1801 domain-containing protein [Brevundimonas sp.]|uniref:DUF1801 domain-containing protein n=1 Tax=Brevundimonas sp. TaxID=1871086 RepID=UPI003919E8AE